MAQNREATVGAPVILLGIPARILPWRMAFTVLDLNNFYSKMRPNEIMSYYDIKFIGIIVIFDTLRVLVRGRETWVGELYLPF